MSMQLDLSAGWELGWCPEPRLTRWYRDYNSWKVETGALVGKPTGQGRAMIHPDFAPEGDYDVQCRFTLPTEDSEIQFVLCYCIHRLAGYYLVFHPGRAPAVHYTFSDMRERTVAESAGPECAAGREYLLEMERRGDTVTLLLDGEEFYSFEADAPCGRYTALCVTAGEGRFHEIRMTVEGQEEPLFFDDFSEDCLSSDVDVELSELAVEEWIEADVPGTVQSSLVKAGKVPDPYVAFNGPQILWVDHQRWVYRKRFTVPEEMRGKRLRLVFDGVDYRAFFWLNGEKLCYHEGMFGGPEIDIGPYVDLEGENELIVCILPCPNPPHNNVRPYILHRWHFNMYIVTLGLWRPVRLVAEDRIFLADPQVITRRIDPDGTAHLSLSVTLGNMVIWPFEAHVRFTLHSPIPGEEPLSVEKVPGFCQGSLRVCCEMEVPNAALWWPAGMGEQPLYQVDVTADLYEYQKQPTPTEHDELHFRTGIRTLRMLPAPDASLPKEITPVANTNPYGLYNWCLSVNGRAFFGKGSNWMPIDQMLRLPRERYDRLLRRVRDCHINLLRPWGAGLLETDEFYDLCDEYGICVWQETLLANGLYDQSRLEVWRDTMRRNICRLRNHPSLVMWCGGNEFDPDVPENKPVVDEIEALCAELDPAREFHRACPYGGDNHSYLVSWMGGQYYTGYVRDLSVAITEFSLASPPCMESLAKLMPPEELQKWPPDLPDDIHRYDYTQWGENVRRRESAFSVLDAHLSSITNVMFPALSECGKPQSMEEFIEYLQTAQGLLTQFGNDFWRSRWPACTMALSWVFNVIFPDSMSWSYVDYFGVPKRSYYFKKRSLEPLHVGAVFDDLFTPAGNAFTARLFVINETLTPYPGLRIRTRLYSTDLRLLWEDERETAVKADDVKPCGTVRYEIPADMADQVLFLCVDLYDEAGGLLSRSQYCPRVGTPSERMPYLQNGPYIADVKKTRTRLEARVEPDGGDAGAWHCIIRNSGEVPAYQVGLHAPGRDQDIAYEDNYFWLEAGEERRIGFTCEGEPPTKLEVSAWNADAVALEPSPGETAL